MCCALQIQAKLLAAKRRLLLIQHSTQPGQGNLSNSTAISCSPGTAESAGRRPSGSNTGQHLQALTGQKNLQAATSSNMPVSGSQSPLQRHLILRERQQEIDESFGLCVVCLEKQPEVGFLPCMHAVTCEACMLKIASKSNECPMCRAPLSSTFRLAGTQEGDNYIG